MSSVPATWIEESLATLEGLEAEREQHEAALEGTDDADELRAHMTAVERLDGEIRGLYTALEAVADEDEEGEDESANSTSGYAAPLDDFDPFAAPSSDANVETATVDASRQVTQDNIPPVGHEMPMTTSLQSYGGYSDSGSGGALKWVAIGVGGLALIVGGVMALSGGDGDTVAQPTGPGTVIQAGAIPEDTQGPKAAIGADVDRTQGTRIRKSNRPRRSGATRSRSSSPRRAEPSGVGADGKIKIQKTKDPIGGV